MTGVANPLARLAATVASVQDEQLERLALKRSTAWARPKRGWNGREWLGVAGWTVAGAAAAAAVLLWWQSRALRYEPHALEALPGAATAAFRAPASDGALRFSDGSVLELQKGSEARIDTVQSNGALIQLDHGQMRASIAKRQHANWRFKAGFFEVMVTGTRFLLSVEPASRSVAVRMEEGSVVVSGCSVERLALAAGQSATLRCDGARPHVEQGSPAPRSSATPVEAAAPIASEAASSPTAASARPVTETQVADAPFEASDAGTPQPKWQALASQGKYREAYAAADAMGFDAQCEGASSRELLELADAAQAAGRGDRAAIALMTVRRRFPGTGASATAAFKLGRMAADQRGAWADARQWFETCLAEAPSGVLAREAMGRLMEMDRAQGNLAGAKARAAQYLQRWPDGPHAELARTLVGK